MLRIRELLIADERLPKAIRDAVASDDTYLAAKPLAETFALECDEVREILQLPALICT
jgi:hypothetical protein